MDIKKEKTMKKYSITRLEVKIVLVVFIILFIALSTAVSLNWIRGHGDNTIPSELLETIAKTGKPNSYFSVSMDEVLYLAVTPAEEVVKMDFPAKDNSDHIFFNYHTYFFAYLVAPFTIFIPTNIVLGSLMGLVYSGMLLIIYFFLRKYKVTILGSVLFCLMISVHPYWSKSLFGQLYLEKIFLALMLLFILVISSKTPKVKWFFITGALCILISERTTIFVACFAVAYSILYWRKNNPKFSIISLAFGLVAIGLGIFFMKYIISHAFATNVYAGVLANPFYLFQYALLFKQFLIFALFNLILLFIFGIFEWRAALIAFGAMLPNILATVGGAEKMGWSTHYHAVYFPILIWAIAFGYIRLHSKLSTKYRRLILYPIIILFIILLAGINPYNVDKVEFGTNYLRDNAWTKTSWFIGDMFKVNGNSAYYFDQARRIKEVIPEGSLVSAPESLVINIYQNRKLYYYPLGIDDVDYVLLWVEDLTTKPYRYSGGGSYLGPENDKKLNELLSKRLEDIGYDVYNPVFINNIAVIKNLKNEPPRLKSGYP